MNQRELFEKWAKENYSRSGYVLVDGLDVYAYGDVQMLWQAWKAAIASQWQPIETAPNDGTNIITYRNGKHGIHIEAMYFADGCWYWSFDGDSPEQQPTHWIPLPPEPTK